MEKSWMEVNDTKRNAVQFVLMALLFVFCLTGSVFAADWQFYGTASVNTFWTDSDSSGQTTFGEVLNPGSAIGAEVKVSDSLSGGFEYDAGVEVVTLFGVWDFGAGSFLVGQDEALAVLGISGQVYDDDRALDGIGEFNPGERAQLRLTFGGFEIAAVEPDTQVATAAGLDDGASEVRLPAIQVRYTFTLDNVDAAVAGAYSAFDYNDEDVDAYVVLASVGATFNRFSLALQGWAGQNVGNIAPQDTRGDGEDGFAVYEAGRIHDVDAWGAALVAQVVFNDMLSMEMGYGYVDLDYDNTALLGGDNDEVVSYYLNLPITLADGVQIVPEIGVIDYHEPGQDEVTYGGAKWQIEF